MEESDRAAIIRDLFSFWDLDGNGTVEYGEMQQILQASQRIDSKDKLKWVKKFEAEINQGQRENRRGSLSSISVTGGGQINFSEVDGEPSLDPDAFVNFLLRLTRKDSDEEFLELVEFSKKWIADASSSTQGDKLKRDIWSIFQMLDSNNDGYVDWLELEVLLNAERKADRKIVLKWKAIVQNKVNEQLSLPGRGSARGAGTPIPEGDDRRLRMDLHTFQLFLHEFVETDAEARIAQLVSVVRKAVQEQQIAYILHARVHDVIQDIMEDLLKERPQDVLAGIEKSVQRLRRTQKFPKPLKKAKDAPM